MLTKTSVELVSHHSCYESNCSGTSGCLLSEEVCVSACFCLISGQVSHRPTADQLACLPCSPTPPRSRVLSAACLEVAIAAINRHQGVVMCLALLLLIVNSQPYSHHIAP